MASNRFLLLLVLFWVAAVDGAHHRNGAAAPAPSVDCSTLVLSMTDCLTYVSNGSTSAKPEGGCCSGLKSVLMTDAECLCEAFQNSAKFGITLNVTKALTLPAACNIKAPSASNCGLSLTPAGAPGQSPSSTAVPPTMSVGSNEQAPAPSPGASGARGLSISVGSLAAATGLVAALTFSF